MGVEARDLLHRAVVLAGDDTMEHRPPEPPSWRIGADTFERSHPGLVLEELGHSTAQAPRPCRSREPVRLPHTAPR